MGKKRKSKKSHSPKQATTVGESTDKRERENNVTPAVDNATDSENEEKIETPQNNEDSEEEESDAESGSDGEGSDDGNEEKDGGGSKNNHDDDDDDDDSEGDKEEENENRKEEIEDINDGSIKKKKKKIKKLSLKKTQDFNAKLRKRGVLYIARIPPRMGPAKVKSLMSEFGTVTRVYLVEEDKTARKKRKKAGGAGGGGGGGKRYIEGWVEFENRKIAKQVGMSLNNTPITNYKRSVHYGDIWNVKFLRKFQWSHLTEKVAYERRVREQKLRIEMVTARRENAAYASLVEAGKKLDRIEERRKKKKNKKDDGGHDDGPSNKKRKFRQTKPVDGKDANGAAKKAVLNALV